jgi:hypothetical protein
MSSKMKQIITEEQLNELTEIGRKKLMQWWDRHYRLREIPLTYFRYGGVPLLSIGQMIEFLEEHMNLVLIKEGEWQLWDNRPKLDRKPRNPDEKEREILDVLWLRVKGKLNEEN